MNPNLAAQIRLHEAERKQRDAEQQLRDARTIAARFPNMSRTARARNNPYANHHHATTQVSATEPPQPTPPLARDREGKAQGAGCPAVRFTLRKCRPFDVDGKYTAIKDLLDGLQYAGLIRGDKEGEVSLEVVQETVKTKAEEETLITITYP
jgi:hypothetical protein